jgi:hypothetical protein
MLSKALEWASVSIVAPLLGNMRGRSILGAFEIKIYIYQALQAGISLCRGPVGEPGGNSLAGAFFKRESISGFIFWTQRTYRF